MNNMKFPSLSFSHWHQKPRLCPMDSPDLPVFKADQQHEQFVHPLILNLFMKSD
jgi:hypothetical protein